MACFRFCAGKVTLFVSDVMAEMEQCDRGV